MIVSYSLDLSTLPAPATDTGITIVGAFVATSIVQDISIFTTSAVTDPTGGTVLSFTVANSGVGSPTPLGNIALTQLTTLNTFASISNGKITMPGTQNNTLNEQLAIGTTVIISALNTTLPWVSLTGTLQINLTINTYPLANKFVTDLPSADTLTGTEILPVVQGDLSVQTTAADIAALGGSGYLPGAPITIHQADDYTITGPVLASEYFVVTNNLNSININLPDFTTVNPNFQNLIIYNNPSDTSFPVYIKNSEGLLLQNLPIGYTFICTPRNYTTETGNVYYRILPTFASNTHKAAVLACSTTNLAVSYSISVITNTDNTSLIVDGVALSVGDSFALVGQTAALQNGIYTVTTITTPWTAARRVDFDSNVDGSILSGASFNVVAGTANAGTQWYLSNTNNFIVGTDPLTFLQLGSSGNETVYDTLAEMNAVTGTPGEIVSCKETTWQYIWRTDILDGPAWYFNGGALPPYPNKQAFDVAMAAGYLNNVVIGTLIPLYNTAVPLELQGNVALVFGWAGPYSDPFPPLNGVLFNLTVPGNLTAGSAVITNIDTTTLQGNEYVRSLYFGNNFNTVTIESIDIVGPAGQITVSQEASPGATAAFVTFNGIDVSSFEPESTYISYYDNTTGKTSFYLFVDPGWQLLTAGGEFDYNFPTLAAMRASLASDGEKAFCFETKWTYRWRTDIFGSPRWTYAAGSLPPYENKVDLDAVVNGSNNVLLEVLDGTTVFAGDASPTYAQIPIYQIFNGVPGVFGLGGIFTGESDINDILFNLVTSGTVTVGSNVITDIASTAGVLVGMYLSSPSWNSTDTIEITAITDTTITVAVLPNPSGGGTGIAVTVNAIDVSAFFPDTTYIAVEDPSTSITSFYLFQGPGFALMGAAGSGGITPYAYIFDTVTEMNAVTGTPGQLAYCRQQGVQGDYVWRTDLSGGPGWDNNYPIILFVNKIAMDNAIANGDQLGAINGSTIFISQLPDYDGSSERLPYIYGYAGGVGRTGYCGTFNLSSDPMLNYTLTGTSTAGSAVITNIDTTNVAIGQYIRGAAWGFSGNPTRTILIEDIPVVDPVNGQIQVSLPAQYAVPDGTYYVNNIDVSAMIPPLSNIVVNDDTSAATGAQFYQFADPYFYLISTKTYANLTDMFGDKDPFMAYGTVVSVTDCGVSSWYATQFIVSQGTPNGFICAGLQPVSDPTVLTAFSADLLSTLYSGITIFVISTQSLYVYNGTNFVQMPLVFAALSDLTAYVGNYDGQEAYCSETGIVYTYYTGGTGWVYISGAVPPFANKAAIIAWVTAGYNTNLLPGTLLIDANSGAQYIANSSSTAAFSGLYPQPVSVASALATIDTTYFIPQATFIFAQDTQLLYVFQSGTNPDAVWTPIKAPVIATSASVTYGGAADELIGLINIQKTGNIVLVTFKCIINGPITSADYITLPSSSIPDEFCPDVGLDLMISARTGINQLTMPGTGISTTPVDLTFFINSDGSAQVALGSFNSTPVLNSGQFSSGNLVGFFDTTLTWTNNS